MTMLGMEADMQCHYFPGYFSMRDINLNAGCSIWPSNNVDKILMNGHYYSGNLAPPSPDQYLAYKEKLKQIMLQHETIFKNQVHELHRLYNKQRELMDEMKRTQFPGQHLQMETSKLNQIFSENSFDYSRRTCKFSASPWLNPVCSQSLVPHVENNQSRVNYVEGNIMQAGCSIVQTEGHRKESELLESKCKKVGKKILDLELPAYMYIDSELEESLAEEMVPPEVPECPMKSFVEDVQNDVELSRGIDGAELVFQDDNVTQASFSMRAKCLADLNVPIKLEEETDNKSNDYVHPVPGHMEIRCQDLPGKGNSDFQFQPGEVDQNTKTRENPQAFPNITQLDKNEDRLEGLYDNDEAGQSSSDLNSVPERRCTQTLSLTSKGDDIEQCPEISPSHPLNPNNRKLLSKRKYFCLESYTGQDSTASKRTSSELIPLDNMVNYDSSSVSFWRKHTHDVERAPIAVQALPCFNNSVCLHRSSKLRSHHIAGDNSCLEINLESEPDEFASEDDRTKKHVKGSMDLKLTRDIDLNSMSPSCASDVGANSICFADGEEKCKESTDVAELNKKLDLDCDSMPDSEEQLNAIDLVSLSRHDKKSSGSKFHVDLNSCINEDESSPVRSILTEVDLQAPESPENKERSPPREESDENQLDMSCQLSMQENGNLPEDLVTLAAEAIVSISSSEVQNHTDIATLVPSEGSKGDSLYWFAKLASSVVDDSNSEFGIALSHKNPDHQDEYYSDGIDYFEAMTLQLEETKLEEYCCKTSIQEEAACPATLPKRGRTRRGRQQRKDFQSEILPSLASLSRYEVNEDLQAIGGLIEAADCSTGARTAGRNGWSRGRRRRPSSSSSKADTPAWVQSKQQTGHGKCSIEERSLIDWGKITRRRRGQRCPASNPRLIVGQV